MCIRDRGRMGILLKDPEGNELEIYHEDGTVEKSADPENLDQESLLRKSEEKYEKLSAGSYFEKIHLNVIDLSLIHISLDYLFSLWL